jgi:two-component system sensor histidine kinase MprB
VKPLRRKPRERRLLLRSRVALATALVVAAAIAAVSLVAWAVTEHNLRAELDQSLTDAGPPHPAGGQAFPPPADLCSPGSNRQPLQRFLEGIQLLRPDGTTCAPSGVDEVVTVPADLAVKAPVLRDGVTASGARVRVLVKPAGGGELLLVSRSTSEVDVALANLRDALLLVAALGVVVAGLAGLLLTRRALAPVERLTTAVEHIARTEDLTTAVEVSGRDEVGRLGRAFTAMTAALSDSRRRQADLVTDAAHELRTPLTSLRTNVDLLVRSEQTARDLPPEHRRKIMASLQSQTVEFTNLVAELVALATDERELLHVTLDMGTLIERAVRRAGNRTNDHEFDVGIEPWTIEGDPAAVERMVLNLLDNAVKFSPAGSVVTVRSTPGTLSVADQGAGLPAEQREQAFERFWRAPEARGKRGSGLGLAIVASTVATYGGEVRFLPPPGGTGAYVRIDLPVSGA